MQVHEFAPFKNSSLPFCESKGTDSFLTTNFNQLIIINLVQNYILKTIDKKKKLSDIEYFLIIYFLTKTT